MSGPYTDQELRDEDGKYRCPECKGRLLRIGNYAECTDCERRFKRSSR